MSRNKPSWLAQLNRITPEFCRMVARKKNGHAPMSNSDIAKVSGLARSTINKLGHMKTWNRVTAATIQRYSLACGVDLSRPGETIKFFRRAKLNYVRNSQPAQIKLYERLMRVDSAEKADRHVEKPANVSSG